MKVATALIALLLGGCADVPWDAEGTMDRVRATKVLRAGVIAPNDHDSEGAQRHFIHLLAAATDSRPRIVEGSAEELLPQVESGELDIVTGRFSHDTPWAERVTILPSLKRRRGDDGANLPAAAIRNGENGWVALVHGYAPALRERDR